MLTEELKCLVCCHTISCSEEVSKTDQLCHAQDKTYQDLIKHILSPITFDECHGPYHMCRECQVLADEFNHHQIQMIDIKNSLSMRFKNSFQSKESAFKSHGGHAEDDQLAPESDWVDSISAAEQPIIEIIDATNLSEMHGDQCPTKVSVQSASLRMANLRQRMRKKRKAAKTLLRCSVCGYVCRERTRLREHLALHFEHQRVWNVCEECGKKFRSLSGLRYHQKVHRGIKPYTCPLCPLKFRANSQVKSHMRARHKESLTSQEGSSSHQPQQETESELLQPEAVKDLSAGEYVYASDDALKTCEVCNMHFMDSTSLQEHLKRHRSVSKHLCEDCGTTFRSRANLESHLLVHAEMRPVFVCVECGKEFKTRSGLAYHEKVHSGVKPHACPLCPAMFRVNGHVKTHLRGKHGISDVESVLRHSSPRKRQQQHELETSDVDEVVDSQTQEEEESWEMECGDVVAKAELSCDLCDKTFVHPANLQKHLLNHGDGKDLRCKVCGKICRRHADLLAHLDTHSDKRPFVCKECGRTFKSYSGLKYHEKVHTGDYPYECQECTVVCRSNSNLKKHVRTVHREAKPLLPNGRVPGRSPTRRPPDDDEPEMTIPEIVFATSPPSSPPPSTGQSFEKLVQMTLEAHDP